MIIIKKIYDLCMGVIAFLSITVIIIAASCLVLQYKPAIVVSGSMEPMIKTGSLLLVDKKDKNIEIGDVIAYKNHDMEVSHRVVEITSNGYVTKGDNNDNVDFYQVRESDITGTVIFSIPKLGYALDWVRSIQGIIVIATICTGCILMGLLRNE